jgi:hypothetical protein
VNLKPVGQRGILALLIALGTSVSCVKKKSSNPAHKTGQVPLRTEPFLWQKQTLEEFKAEVLPRMFVSAKASDLLPETHPRSALIQNAMNRIHKLIIKKYPSLSQVPQPQAALFTDPQPNAFVETVRNCFDKPVLLPGSSDKPIFEDAIRITKNGAVADTEDCRGAESTLMNSIFAFNNSLSHGCKIENKEKALALSEGCKINRYFDKYSSAKRFSFERISSVIYFSTGLFDVLGDDNLVLFIVMHELAHYYRAHPLLPAADFASYYEVGDKNAPGCPIPNPQLTRLAQEENWPELKKTMLEKRLGFYTYEQEADELALEFLAELNIPTEIGSEAMMRILKHTKSVAADELNYEACAALKKQKWLTPDQKSAYVPIGNLADPHHSLCYRAYNIDRERETHCFK